MILANAIYFIPHTYTYIRYPQDYVLVTSITFDIPTLPATLPATYNSS